MKSSRSVPIGGLFLKIASLVSLTLIIAVGLTTIVSIRAQTKTITTQLIGQNKYISRHLASSIKSAFWTLNWLFVEKQMQEIATSDEVVFLRLLKPNGEVYLSAGDQMIETLDMAPDTMEPEGQLLKDGSSDEKDAPIKLIITPVQVADDQWTLITGLSLDGAKQVARGIIIDNIILGGTIFVLGVFISFFFATDMTRPIRKLVEGTNEIGKGNLDYRIEIKSHDEIGDLAASFNKMAEDLKKTTASRDQLNLQISERRQIEEALRQSEKRFRALTENTSDITAILDEHGAIKYVSPSVERTLHYTAEEMLGQEIFLFLPPKKGLKGIRKFFYEALKEPGKAVSVPDLHLQDKHGQWLIFESLLTSMMEISGINGVVVNCRDVTERIRAREENKALENQLQRAQKMHALGTLAGGVAHDLNNILSGVVSYPELLLMDLPEESPLRRPLLTIQASGKKAAAIVQDLLTLARRGVCITQVLNLNDVIQDYLGSPECGTLRRFHPHVEIETDLGPDLFNVTGSPVHLGKTVMNLVSNAAEAILDRGKVLITTRNRYIDRSIAGYDAINEGDYALLSVSDTGIGISPEDLDRIFEPFYSKKVMGRSGTGLGMAVVWGTVKDHHGYIDVESVRGQGTTFKLFFPVTREELPKARDMVSIRDYMGKGEKILVVDDVEEQRRIASEILLKLGYLPTVVSSGEEAVEYLKSHSADLLVLDMIMDPGIDGLETYKRIIDIQPGQKALIASGFSESEHVKRAQEIGAGPYVKKPYTLEQIGIAIRRELERA